MSHLFNAEYYLANNADVAAAGYTEATAYQHYIDYGAEEDFSGEAQRAPNGWFDVNYYLSTYPDLQANGVTADTALLHFATYGLAEGRDPNADVAAADDNTDDGVSDSPDDNADIWAQYAANNPDLQSAFGIDGGADSTITAADLSVEEIVTLRTHYYQYGWSEDRPKPDFVVNAVADGDDGDGGEGGGDAGVGETFDLSPDNDNVDGTGDDDTVNADVEAVDGVVANTLNSGDNIDGNGGNDTIDATLYAGLVTGQDDLLGSQTSIGANTDSVENLEVTALGFNGGIGGVVDELGNVVDIPDTAFVDNDTVYVSGRDMEGLTDITSSYSRANLFVTDVQAGPDDELVSDVTVGMDHTGSDDNVWDASNMTVLFDQDDLTQSQDQGGYFLEFLNRHIDDLGIPDVSEADAKPVEDLQIEQLEIKVGGETYDLAPTPEQLEGVNTIQQLVDVLNDIADNKPGVPDSVTFEVGPEWSDLFTGVETPRIVLTNEGKGIEVGTIDVGLADLNGDLVFNQGPRDNTIVPVAVDVDLTKVGASSDGGGLIIGSMSKEGDNELDATHTVNDTVAGVETFNVTVNGNASLTSSLAYLQSTNNVLREVVIDSDNGGADTFADLIIGNSNTLDAENSPVPPLLVGVDVPFGGWRTNAEALKDVATLDASDFSGDLTVFAGLTDEFVAKYGVDDKAVGDQSVDYTGGSGNDTIRIAVHDSVAAQSQVGGSNLDLTVMGGDGDDLIDIDGAGGGSLSEAGDPGVSGDGENGGAWTLFGGAGNDTYNLSDPEGDDGLSEDENALGNSTIVFEQSTGVGDDTIIDFSHAPADAAPAEEVQTLDFTTLDVTGSESVTLSIAGKTVVYQADIDGTATDDDIDDDGEVGGAELATALANSITAAAAADPDFLFSATAASGILTVSADDGAGTAFGNIDHIKAELSTGEIVVGSTTALPAGTDGNTDEELDGNDVLDFSSWNLDDLVVVGEGAYNTALGADGDLGAGGVASLGGIRHEGPGSVDLPDTSAFMALVNQEIGGVATNEYNVVYYANAEENTVGTDIGTLTFEEEGGAPVNDELLNATDANFIINDIDAGVFA